MSSTAKSSTQQRDVFQETIEKLEKERAELLKRFDELINTLKRETEKLKQQVS